MSDDKRDHRKPITPPLGISKQIAGPINKQPISRPDDDGSYETHTPTHPTPVHVQINQSERPLEAVERRSRDIKNTSISTLRLVGEVRAETDVKLRALDEKIDTQAEVLDDLRFTVGKLAEKSEGQNNMIIQMLREQVNTITSITVTEAQTRNARAMTEIGDDSKDKQLRRDIWRKATFTIFGGTGIVAAIFLLIQQKC